MFEKRRFWQRGSVLNKVIDEPRKILKALNKADWNKAKVARMLGISRQTIYRKIEEYNIYRSGD
ncbi:hypothetical protein PITCH_A950009 [uncultured Desulfobacterium sp.]|uniref:DNA binding HTH domain-containing protein n=1 Tax=uncultured Desulfobacterium sp. TaxID=201089 RepID=A0A445N424_9BACT|nr:hypothetical protein PITCH_A950009 [uncultured Desulfobacterium sp.]